MRVNMIAVRETIVYTLTNILAITMIAVSVGTGNFEAVFWFTLAFIATLWGVSSNVTRVLEVEDEVQNSSA
jgi:hypothetical protein